MVTYMVISTFVIVVQMFLEAYFFNIAKALGAYVGQLLQTVSLWVELKHLQLKTL